MVISGCANGGGSGGGSVTPPPTTPVITSVSMTSTPTNATTTAGGANIALTAAAQGTNLDVSLSYSGWAVDGIAGGSSSVGTIVGSGANATYAPPATEATSTQHKVTVGATDQTATGTGTITVTVNPQTSTPVITSVSLTSTPTPAVTTAGGANVALTTTVNGSNLTSITYAYFVNGIANGNATVGTISGSGANATYAPPATVATQTAFAITVTATDAPATGNGGPLTVTVNPQTSTAIITSAGVTPTTSTVYVPGIPDVLDITVYGTGFQNDCVPAMTPNINILNYSVTNSNQIQVTIGFDSGHWNPAFVKVSTTCGGVTSNTVDFAFLGIMNQMVENPTDFGVLDQQAGLVRKYKIADGSADGTITVGGGVNSIALDDVTGDLVAASNFGVGVYSFASGSVMGGVTPNGPVAAVAAKSGYACFTEYTSNDVASLNLASFTVTRVTIPGIPWNVAMTTVGGSLTAVVLTIQTPTLWTIAVPSLSATGSVTLPNLTPEGSLPVGFGGWQLTAFNSGPEVGTAVVLSSYDSNTTSVNLSPATVTKQVTLAGVVQGTAFRMAGNLADGSVDVAIADPKDILTKLVKVSPSGTVTPLAPTNAFSFLATGLGPSTDGTKIYGANGPQSGIVANQ